MFERYFFDHLQMPGLFTRQLKAARLVGNSVWTFPHKRSRFHRLSCFKTMRRFSDNDWISRKCSSLHINDKRLIFPARQNPLPSHHSYNKDFNTLGRTAGALESQCLLMSFGTAALHGNELYHCFAWCHFLTEGRLLLVAWMYFISPRSTTMPAAKR